MNDYSLATRILEVTKVSCGNNEAEIWPYMMQVRQCCNLEGEVFGLHQFTL